MSDKFDTAWLQIVDWLKLNARPILDSLNPPASSHEIDGISEYYGIEIPRDLQQLYSLHNGQNDSGKEILNFFYGELFLPISYSLSYHEGAYADDFSNRGWSEFRVIDEEIDQSLESVLSMYPLGSIHNRQSLLLDLKPSSKGVFGQVVYIDIEMHCARKVADSVTDLLVNFSRDLKQGNYTVAIDSPGWLETTYTTDYLNWDYNRGNCT